MAAPDLPGQQWTPSNSDQGYAFIEDWCGRCARDKAIREGLPLENCDDSEICQIIARSFRSQAIEWREQDGKVFCTEFVPADEGVQYRCPMTVDMFGGGE